MHRLILTLGLSAPVFGAGYREECTNATNGVSLLAVRVDKRRSEPLGVPDHDVPDILMDDISLGNMSLPPSPELTYDIKWVLSGGKEGVPPVPGGKEPSLSTLEEAGFSSTKGDKCANFEPRDIDGVGVVEDIAATMEGGASLGSGIAAMVDLAKFSGKLGAASGALGIAGGGAGIAGEFFFDDPNDARIEAVETAVECLDAKVNRLAAEVRVLTKRVDEIEKQLSIQNRSIFGIQLDEAIDEMKDFIGVTAKKFTEDDCLRNAVRGSDGWLYENCNAKSLWDKVEDFRDHGIHEWKQFREKSWVIMDIVRGAVPVQRQKFYINTIIQQATAGMNIALLVYNVVNAWALNICKWRYKHFEQADSIPAEGNNLCVEDPSESAPNRASHTLKEIVTEAREGLVEMALEANAFVAEYLDYCTPKAVWPVIDLHVGASPRYCSQFYMGEYYEWITPPSDAEKFRRGCCSMHAPYDDYGPWYPRWGNVKAPLPFGIPSESYMWANFVQPVQASLQPPLPARELTLQSPRRRRTLYGYGGYGGFGGFPVFGGFGGFYGGFR